jgi:hypothetical protein
MRIVKPAILPASLLGAATPQKHLGQLRSSGSANLAFRIILVSCKSKLDNIYGAWQLIRAG